ncbi:hypothetical protein [Micromonospora sp. NPDC050695]|uniref:hypothetical protein n=1 Tax=Micromonospora sp. NPDC050695 TaxID=3154938 RepID=UPI0033C69644
MLMSVMAVAVGTLFGACGSPQPSPVRAEDFLGEWCSAQRDQLNLDVLGEFRSSDLSHEFLAVLQDDDEYTEESVLKRDYGGEFPASGRGTWTWSGPLASPRLRLEFVALGLSRKPISGELMARRDGQGEPSLFGYEDDPDAGYAVKFVRCG